MNLLDAYTKLLDDPTKIFVHLKGQNTPINYLIGSSALNIISGSFNPLHEGHKNIYETVKRQFPFSGTYYEISIARFGKDSYSVEKMVQILGQFDAPVIVTNAPTYLEKIGSLPISSLNFHIGFDVACQLVRQYGVFGVNGIPCIFYVYDRNGTLSDLPKVPKNMKRIEHNSEFQHLSSSNLRKVNSAT